MTLLTYLLKSGIEKCEIVRDATVYVNYFLQIFMSIAMLVYLGEKYIFSFRAFRSDHGQKALQVL